MGKLKGIGTKISVGGQVVAAQTECTLNADVEMLQVLPLPGSSNEGWAKFEQGARSWSVSNSSFYSSSEAMLNKAVNNSANAIIAIVLTAGMYYRGYGVLTDVSVEGTVGNLSKVQINFEGEGFPKLILG